MSYKKSNSGDLLKDYFVNLINFVIIAPNLLKANNKRNFEIWLEKLEEIDRRALFRYLKLHKNKINPDYLRIAQRRFIKEI